MKIRNVLAVIAGVLLACSAQAQSSIGAVGVIMAAPQHTVKITGVLPNTPAARAGLTKGLLVKEIDGTPTSSMELKQCIDKMRGAAGTTVTLVLVDPKTGATNKVKLTREKMNLPPGPGGPAHGP